MIRVLHTGDLHIGSYPGPEKNGENARYLDTLHALDSLVCTALTTGADIAIIAGDVFHQARVWSDRGLKENRTAVNFIRKLAKICPVVVMRGTPNHDSDEQFNMLRTALEGDNSITIVTEPGVQTIHTYTGATVQVACLPGFDRGYYRAKHPGLSKEEENEVFTKAIAEMILGLKAQCSPYEPSILVSHFTVAGCNMESGQTAFFSQFEPIVYPDTLAAADFDLTCFGHIHRPQQLEGCKNAFYCGAISQFNFNDEGQKRGFWIHTVSDTGAVQSEFQELPTREFLTIRLDDGKVAGINESESERWSDIIGDPSAIEQKIVRVLYSCTDEHNKAFNHAALEKWLYETGKAFWVQEITPEKISVSVDKKALGDSSSPEENLAAYLAEKEVDEKRIASLVELARPIIAAAEAAKTKTVRSGLFTPVEIEVHNYRNYRDETFSFDPIKFCTINGNNGVGKSSLFMDAIVDALYEEPREGDLTGWICNDPEARSGYIKFTFKLGETEYRVTRTRTKSGKATLNLSEKVDGEWEDRSCEKLRDTQEAIVNTIGADSLTLKACALIMQDQYGLFLQADKEARMNILGSILGLGIYDMMEEAASERATETNRRIRQIEEKADTLVAGLPDPEQLENEIDEKEEHRKAFTEKAEEATKMANTAKTELAACEEAAQRLLKYNTKKASLINSQTAKTAELTALTLSIYNLTVALAKEPEIAEGLKRYNAALAEEKRLLEEKGKYESLATRVQELRNTKNSIDLSLKSLKAQRATIVLMKIGPLSQALEQENELKEKHQEYAAICERIAELEKLEPEYGKVKTELDLVKERIGAITAEWEAEKARRESGLQNLKEKSELLQKANCAYSYSAECIFLKDAREAAKRYESEFADYLGRKDQHSEEIIALEKRREEVEEELEAIPYSLTEARELVVKRNALRDYEEKYNALETRRTELAHEQSRLEDLDKRIAEAEGNAQKAVKAIETLEEERTALSYNNAAWEKVQSDLAAEAHWAEEEKQLPVLRERIATSEKRQAEISQELADISEQISEIDAERDAEAARASGIGTLREIISKNESLARANQSSAQDVAMQIGDLMRRLQQYRTATEEASKLRKEVVELGVTAAGYEELKKAFSQDGIPHNIIRSVIPALEATATNILGQMSGGKMSVEFVTEKTLKSNSKKEVTALDIIINDAVTGRLPYMSRSGGERVKAALSVILALAEIKSSKVGEQFGFLAIDEPPYLDQDGTQAYCDALETIQVRYPNTKVIAISHDESFKARFPQSITIYKDETGSHILKE